MKKLISIILSIVLIVSAVIPAFAAGSGTSLTSSVPVILIRGDSNEISYDNGTKTFTIDKLIEIFGNSEDGSISEAAQNILYPFIVKGILFNDWDDYYEAVYKEISDVFDPIKLDANGNPKDDTGILQWQKDNIASAMKVDRADKNGRYAESTYQFYYDWRLDPIELADQLHEYIEGVKKATGHDKVSMSLKCLGSNVALAYINKYGTESIKGIGFDVATSMGADFLSGMVSGDFGIDGSAISRYATYMTEKEDLYTEIARFATSTIDLLEVTGVIDTLTNIARQQLYSKIEYGIISALSLSTMMTFPGYWALIKTEDFDDALRYVFGEEGSDKRTEYKGLIDKITNYNETIKKNVYPLMQEISDSGVNLCIVSKYGVPMIPVLKDGSILGDEYVSAHNSSFGATTSNLYGTLSDKYIKEQTEKGLERYISPDKQIDASTCLFPDYTWFFKGAPHGFYTTPEMDLIMQVIDADTQLTVNDFELTQFVSYSFKNKTAEPMTTENCGTEFWTADETIDHPTTKAEKLRSFIITIINWAKNMIKLFAYLIG